MAPLAPDDRRAALWGMGLGNSPDYLAARAFAEARGRMLREAGEDYGVISRSKWAA